MTNISTNKSASLERQWPTKSDLEQALTTVNKRVSRGLQITHGSYIAFLLLMSWLNFQPADASFKLWLVKIIPLLIFVPGMIQRRYRTYSWLCFAILPYFIWVTPLVMGRGSWSDWMMVGLIAVLFTASMMSSRWLQQQSYLSWQIQQS